jgi:HK97 gp10 family phage protein
MDNIRNRLLASIYAICQETAEKIRNRYREEGHASVAETIEVTQTENGASIEVNHTAAKYIEFGTQNTPANSILQTSFEESKQNIHDRLIEEYSK